MELTPFELATRQRLMFPSANGPLDVSELWNLPLTTTREGRASLENVGQIILADLDKLGSTRKTLVK